MHLMRLELLTIILLLRFVNNKFLFTLYYYYTVFRVLQLLKFAH